MTKYKVALEHLDAMGHWLSQRLVFGGTINVMEPADTEGNAAFCGVVKVQGVKYTPRPWNRYFIEGTWNQSTNHVEFMLDSAENWNWDIFHQPVPSPIIISHLQTFDAIPTEDGGKKGSIGFLIPQKYKGALRNPHPDTYIGIIERSGSFGITRVEPGAQAELQLTLTTED